MGARRGGEGLEACEALTSSVGAFLFAAMPTLAEVCLVPQLTNARRFEVDLSVYPRPLASGAGLPGVTGFHGCCAATKRCPRAAPPA